MHWEKNPGFCRFKKGSERPAATISFSWQHPMHWVKSKSVEPDEAPKKSLLPSFV
jgi:hypothetical protein